MHYIAIVGLAVTIIGGLIAYLISTNTRITRVETILTKLADQDCRLRALEKANAVNTELLKDIKRSR